VTRRGAIAMRGLAAAAGLLLADAAAGAAVASLRDTGYFLGDLVDERVTVDLPQGYRLDPDSLPLPGRVAPWLEVRAARGEPGRDGGTIDVVVTYQIFAETEQAARVPIPAFTLRLRGANGTVPVEVAEQSFLLSPALPPTLADQDREIKPSPPPILLPRAGAIAGVAIASFAALACGAFLLWLHDRLPWLPRAPGPFAQLWRRWRRRARRGVAPAEHAVLLREWHAALNRAAGETLYAATMPRLFERAPHLASLRVPLERVFASSWSYFYAPGSPAPAWHEVFDLVRAAAARERGLPC